MVSHEHSNFSLSLKLSKDSIEPLEDVTWVVMLGHEIEVHVVAGGVDFNNVHSFNILKGTISVLNSEALTVVTVLGIHYISLVIKVLVPKLEIVGNPRVLLGEILRVGLDEIVVSFEGVKSIRLQICGKELSKAILETGHIGERLGILIMRGKITTPEDDNGLNLLVDNFSHGGYNVNGDIAVEGAKEPA